MKYIKKFEEIENPQVGNYIYVDPESFIPNNKISYDTKYQIVSLGETKDFRKTCKILDMDGNYKNEWFLSRFISEEEYNTRKYNL